MAVSALLILMSTTLVAGQRPFFAGSRPIGFPDTPNRTTTERNLGNRFGDDTTERLPIEANGDRDLVDRLSRLPIDQQPFWFINWKAYEEQRKKPQTFPQKPNVFIDPVTSNVGSSSSNSANSFTNSNAPTPIAGISNPNLNSGSFINGVASNSQVPISNDGTKITFSNPGFVPFMDVTSKPEVPKSNDGTRNTFSNKELLPFAGANANTELPIWTNQNSYKNPVNLDRSGSASDSAVLDERFGDCRCDKTRPTGGFVRAEVNHQETKNIRNLQEEKGTSNVDSNEGAMQYAYVKAPIQNYKLSDYDLQREEYFQKLMPYIRRRLIIID